ncbi:HTH domain-containing protein [Aliivibrio logei]|uniref:HTH domain-containing protein n=1 Tax=Aliivibrio logei TaxID=688 RepID=UPI0035C88060
MSRSQRLLDLLQLLRCYKYPVSAESLANKLDVSVRTIYRDIATLQAQGAEIEGEVGLGYILTPGFDLPPMMLTVEELEALRLGAEWVAKQANVLTPSSDVRGGGTELSIPAKSRESFDTLFENWKQQGVEFAQEPEESVYGINFVALDLDGHRIRVFF